MRLGDGHDLGFAWQTTQMVHWISECGQSCSVTATHEVNTQMAGNHSSVSDVAEQWIGLFSSIYQYFIVIIITTLQKACAKITNETPLKKKITNEKAAFFQYYGQVPPYWPIGKGKMVN